MDSSHDYQLSPLSLPSVCMATPPHDYQLSPLSLPSVCMYDYSSVMTTSRLLCHCLQYVWLPSDYQLSPLVIAFSIWLFLCMTTLPPLSLLSSVCMATPLHDYQLSPLVIAVSMYGYSLLHDYQLSPLSLPSVCMATPPHDYQLSPLVIALQYIWLLLRMTTSCLLCHCQFSI
ncbi:unnamed protein product [Mytilus edulis]|uniref:Uncharacterized protein n=1 Tax=Mytilus edulis TaxID=6550 RepID=A0A8S3TZM0_MYTED|nr:unnamed protein product [Mytilus edulis]